MLLLRVVVALLQYRLRNATRHRGAATSCTASERGYLLCSWRADDSVPIETPVTSDQFLVLTPEASLPIPNFLLPPTLHNEGNYIISLAQLCVWLGGKAEEMGVEVRPGPKLQCECGLSVCLSIIESSPRRRLNDGQPLRYFLDSARPR